MKTYKEIKSEIGRLEDDLKQVYEAYTSGAMPIPLPAFEEYQT